MKALFSLSPLDSLSLENSKRVLHHLRSSFPPSRQRPKNWVRFKVPNRVLRLFRGSDWIEFSSACVESQVWTDNNKKLVPLVPIGEVGRSSLLLFRPCALFPMIGFRSKQSSKYSSHFPVFERKKMAFIVFRKGRVDPIPFCLLPVDGLFVNYLLINSMMN